MGARARQWSAGLVVAAAVWTAVAASAVAAPELELVSRADGPQGAKGDRDSSGSRIAADGRSVVFVSGARNLSPDDDDERLDVYVRNLRTHRTTLVSRASGVSGPKAELDAFDPDISADGHIVTFVSAADGLVADDQDGAPDVFARDLATNMTTLVSRSDGADGANGAAPAVEAAVSGDGRLVAFHGEGLDSTRPGSDQIFVRDRISGGLTTLSDGNADGNALGASFEPDISADGRRVAWEAMTNGPEDPPESRIFVHDLATGDTETASPAGWYARLASLSADGSRVAYTAGEPIGASCCAAYVHDTGAPPEETTLVSRLSGADGAPAFDFFGRGSPYAEIAPSGDAVLFSTPGFLIDRFEASYYDVFVRDLRALTTTLISGHTVMTDPWPPEVWAEGRATLGSLSADRRLAAFSSSAPDLLPADPDILEDVYVRRLAPRNHAPDCSALRVAPRRIRYATRRMVRVRVRGALDTDGDAVTLTVQGIRQDEPVGRSAPDAKLSPSPGAPARVRAERRRRGDGRVYRLAVHAADPAGAACDGTVRVDVPRRPWHRHAVDSAPPSYDSTAG